jgi:DNA-binding transcriptional ArsR family regulator
MTSATAALEALADPTRRAILEQLLAGPRPVGALAAELPISRPAVSQHLSVLLRAGLVAVSQEGTRRVYRVDRAGLDELRRWVDGFWDRALDAFGAAAEKEMVRER